MNRTRQWRAIGVGVVIAGVTAVSAQSPESTMSREVVSATGCVVKAGANGDLAAAAGAAAGAGFVLKGVRIASPAGLVEAPRTPSSGTPSSNEGSEATNTADPGTGAPPAEARASGADIAGRGDTGLLLVPDRGVALADHVGHRVMVTGRLSSFAAPGGVASSASGRTLTVTKVTLIAPACTTGS
jgi:hypothetical protein